MCMKARACPACPGIVKNNVAQLLTHACLLYCAAEAVGRRFKDPFCILHAAVRPAGGSGPVFRTASCVPNSVVASRGGIPSRPNRGVRFLAGGFWWFLIGDLSEIDLLFLFSFFTH